MDELNLDFQHNLNAITRIPPQFVVFDFYLTDSLFLRHTVMGNGGVRTLWQWAMWSPFGLNTEFRTLGSNPLGFPAEDLPVPSNAIGDLLANTMNPLNSLMWAHSFADLVVELSQYAGEWLDSHKFKTFNNVTAEEKVWLVDFEHELDERLWAIQERLTTEALTVAN